MYLERIKAGVITVPRVKIYLTKLSSNHIWRFELLQSLVEFTLYLDKRQTTNWKMALCSKNFPFEEIINLMIRKENETKKVLRSRERKQMELNPSESMSKNSKVKTFYEKVISKFASL